jgi:hypothetical protein
MISIMTCGCHFPPYTFYHVKILNPDMQIENRKVTDYHTTIIQPGWIGGAGTPKVPG